MPKVKSTTRRQNLQQIGNQLASLVNNPDCPHEVAEGIKTFFCEIGSVVPLWHASIAPVVFPLLVQAAEADGIDIREPNMVGQDIANNPQVYGRLESGGEAVN